MTRFSLSFHITLFIAQYKSFPAGKSAMERCTSMTGSVPEVVNDCKYIRICTVHEECDCDPGVDDDDQIFEK